MAPKRKVKSEGAGPAEGVGPPAAAAAAGGRPAEIRHVEMVLENPFLQNMIWKPDAHASLESFLQSIETLKYGYDLARVDARFDKDHKVFRVNSVADLETYLSLEPRGPLYVRVPEARDWPTGIARNLHALTVFSVDVGKKVMNRFMEWVSRSDVDEKEVKREEEALRGLVSCEEFRAFGEVNQYEGVDMAAWDAFIQTLKGDDLPEKVIRGLVRASMMQRLHETCFDLDYRDGRLRSAFLVRLLTMKLANGRLNAVIFHYQLRFVSAGAETAALTPEQALAIERFVDRAALLKWKEKLQVSDADDDVF